MKLKKILLSSITVLSVMVRGVNALAVTTTVVDTKTARADSMDQPKPPKPPGKDASDAGDHKDQPKPPERPERSLSIRNNSPGAA